MCACRWLCLQVCVPVGDVSPGQCEFRRLSYMVCATGFRAYRGELVHSFVRALISGTQCLLERSKAHPPMKPVIVRTDTSCAGDTETDPVASEQCPPCPLCSAALPTVQAVLSLLGVEVHHGMCGSLCHQGASFLCDSHCCAYLGHLCTAQEQLDPGRSSGVLVPPAHIRGLLWQLSLLT